MFRYLNLLVYALLITIYLHRFTNWVRWIIHYFRVKR